MSPNILGFIAPGFLNQVPTLILLGNQDPKCKKALRLLGLGKGLGLRS